MSGVTTQRSELNSEVMSEVMLFTFANRFAINPEVMSKVMLAPLNYYSYPSAMVLTFYDVLLCSVAPSPFLFLAVPSGALFFRGSFTLLHACDVNVDCGQEITQQGKFTWGNYTEVWN